MPSLPKFGPRVTFTGFYQEFSKVIDFVMVSAASLRKIKVVQTGVIVENDSCNVGSTMDRQVSINVCLLSLLLGIAWYMQVVLPVNSVGGLRAKLVSKSIA